MYRWRNVARDSPRVSPYSMYVIGNRIDKRMSSFVNDLEARIESVQSTAQNLMLAASHGATADLLDGIRQGVPKLAAVVRANGDALRFPPDGRLQTAPA